MIKNLEKFKQSSASEIVWPGADQKLARNFHEPTLPDISNNVYNNCFPFIGKVWPTRRHNKLCRNWGGLQSLQLQQVSSALSGGFHQGNKEAAKQLLGCYWCGL